MCAPLFHHHSSKVSAFNLFEITNALLQVYDDLRTQTVIYFYTAVSEDIMISFLKH